MSGFEFVLTLGILFVYGWAFIAITATMAMIAYFVHTVMKDCK